MSDELRNAVETDQYEFVDYYDEDLSYLSDEYVDAMSSENYYN